MSVRMPMSRTPRDCGRGGICRSSPPRPQSRGVSPSRIMHLERGKMPRLLFRHRGGAAGALAAGPAPAQDTLLGNMLRGQKDWLWFSIVDGRLSLRLTQLAHIRNDFPQSGGEGDLQAPQRERTTAAELRADDRRGVAEGRGGRRRRRRPHQPHAAREVDAPGRGFPAGPRRAGGPDVGDRRRAAGLPRRRSLAAG